MEPLHIARRSIRRTHHRMRLVLLEPAVQVEIVVLLAPKHSRKRLAINATFILVQRMRSDPVIELVGVRKAGGEDRVKLVEWPSGGFFTQSQAHGLAASGGHFEAVMRGGFRPGL